MFQSFADDTQLMHCFDVENITNAVFTLQEDVNNICNYSAKYNLSINPEKTKILLFCALETKKRDIADFLRISIDDIVKMQRF